MSHHVKTNAQFFVYSIVQKNNSGHSSHFRKHVIHDSGMSVPNDNMRNWKENVYRVIWHFQLNVLSDFVWLRSQTVRCVHFTLTAECVS